MINFEDEDFDLEEDLLADVLPSSRICKQAAGIPVRPANPTTALKGGTKHLPVSTLAHAGEDATDFSCTPDSVSVSQIFGLRAASASHCSPHVRNPVTMARSSDVPHQSNDGRGVGLPAVSSGRGGIRSLVTSERGVVPPMGCPAVTENSTSAALPPAEDMFEADPFTEDDLLDCDLLNACDDVGVVGCNTNAGRIPVPKVCEGMAKDDQCSSSNVSASHTRNSIGSVTLRPGDDTGRDAVRLRPVASLDAGSASSVPSVSVRGTPEARAYHPSSLVDGTRRLSAGAAAGDSPSSTDVGRGESPAAPPLAPASVSGSTPARTGGGRRSGDSAVKRRFPGPAGVLPDTGSVLTLAHEISLNEENDVEREDETSHRLQDCSSQTQCVLSQSDPSAWEGAPWRCVLAELGLNPDRDDTVLTRINISAIKRSAANNKLRKVPLLVVALLSLDATSDLSYRAKFTDLTGEMEGTVAKDAFEASGGALRPGAVLVLREVSVWRESARRQYLSVTRRSLLMLAAESEPGTDTAALVKLSEFSLPELLSARLVEEPSSVPVLYESPPSSPPRQQLYTTSTAPSQQHSGGRGRGGRWRGRGGWRGRGRGAFRSPGASPADSRARRGGASAERRGASTPYNASAPGGNHSRVVNSAPKSSSPAPRLFGGSYRNGGAHPTAGAAATGCGGSSGGAKRPLSDADAASPALKQRVANVPARPASSAAAGVSSKQVPATTSAPNWDAMFDDDDDALFGEL